MRFELDHVVVVDEGLYVGNGLVNRWIKGIGVKLLANIVEAAPERTGVLRAGIKLTNGRVGLRVITAEVTSTAHHTSWVLRGTAGNGIGFIYSKRGWRNRALVGHLLDNPGDRSIERPLGLWMRLSDARGGAHLRVHGQKANNFMIKGYNATARTHRSLHPL